MQSTTCFHDDVANTILQEAALVFHKTVPFYSTNRMFDTDADGRDRMIGCFFPWGEFTAPWFFLRLNDGNPIERKTLKPHILIETTPVGQGIAGQICQAFIMGFAFIGVAQEAHVTGFVDDQQVFDCVALLLTAVMVLLLFWIFRAMDRPLRTIMPTRGDVDSPFACAVLSKAAKSSAVRAGSSS
jgi:hypothetical protein